MSIGRHNGFQGLMVRQVAYIAYRFILRLRVPASPPARLVCFILPAWYINFICRSPEL